MEMGDLFKLMDSFNKGNNNQQAENMLNLFSRLNSGTANQNAHPGNASQNAGVNNMGSNSGLDISKLLPLLLSGKGGSASNLMPLLSQMPGFNTYKPMLDLFNNQAKATSVEKNKPNIKSTLTIKNYKKLN